MGIEMDENIKSNRLADRVNYQEGSVVSRTLMKKDHGTLTLFAFGEGQGLSEHTTPFDSMVYVLDGTTHVYISSKSRILNEGEMVIMPGNEPHALKAIQKFKMLLTMITVLMQCKQSVGIDLPQKALVWEDSMGQVWLSYNNPQYLAERHQITKCGEVIGKIKNALSNFTKAATSP